MRYYAKHDECLFTVSRDPDGKPLLAISGPEDAFTAIAFTDDALLDLVIFLLRAMDPERLKLKRTRRDTSEDSN